jgi:ABC-2 type transport system ATP-binding protein
VIELDDVHRSYGAQRAVNGLSFRVEAGECVGLVGLNGAGKSTTLRLLAGVSLPTRGVVRIDGQALTAASHALRARIGYLPETPPVYAEMGVAAFLRFAACLRGLGRREAQRATEQALSTCDLERVAGQSITTLSHGTRQRVGIAQAIVHGPSVLLLDEPGQGLDPAQSLALRVLLRKLRGAHTIVLSTHHLAEVRDCAERLLLVHEGRLFASGSEAELAARCAPAGMKVIASVRGERHQVEAALRRVQGTLVRVDVVAEGLRVEVSGQGDLRAALSRALIEAGCELLELSSATAGLEQVFAALSGAPS